MKNNWWIQKAKEIQQFADTNDMQKFYEALKTLVSMVQVSMLCMVKSKDGNRLIRPMLR